MTFEELHIVEPILKALKHEGYTHPTPIQQKAIPILLRGHDLLGCAQTGTGKTCAFGVPILQQMWLDNQANKRKRRVRALIITPTRELAIQIGDSLDAYGRFTGLKNTVIFGGVKQKKQTDALARGVDILVATPGRLLDLIGQGFIFLDDIEYFVLDEADRMLDMGFIHDIRKVLRLLPEERQSLFFSATMAPEIVKLSRQILGDPKKVTVKPEQTTAERVQQSLYYVSKKNKIKLLIHLLETEDIHSALVFSRTKHGANKIVKLLGRAGIKAEAIHGNKSQAARQKALGNFKKGHIDVLVATDIAARGIDVDSLSHVINYDLPNIPESYVHRIGRTGRAGASGIAISFCMMDERPYLKDIQKLIKQQIPVIEEHPFLGEDEPSDSGQSQQQRHKPRQKPKGRHNQGRNQNSNREKSSAHNTEGQSGQESSGEGKKKRRNKRRKPPWHRKKKGPSNGGGSSGGNSGRE